MVRASIVIAAHNEGDNLWRTVRSCRETTEGLGVEIVVADDATTDGSVAELRRRDPGVRIARHRTRRGVSATKDLAARRSRGRSLIFVDGHCKPEEGAIARLVEDLEELDGQAIVIPRIPALDCETWRNSRYVVGNGFKTDLESFACQWVDRDDLVPRGRYFESPVLVGCCLAVSRRLYLRLRGFDRDMLEWGIEDLDFGVKAWLLGHPVLLDPQALIGHRFRTKFDNFPVAAESILVNRMRAARKNLGDGVWEDWLARARRGASKTCWTKARRLFRRGLASLERERAYLQRHRVHDEFWYAERFGLDWPRQEESHSLREEKGSASTVRHPAREGSSPARRPARGAASTAPRPARKN